MTLRYLAALLATTLLAHAADTPSYTGLGAASVSAETLAQFRATPLDPELSRKVQNAFDLRAPGAGVLSPDGKSLYFPWRVTGVNQIWRVDGPRSFPIQMTGGEDSTTLASITPDGKWLVLQRDRNGEENPGIYLQDAQGGELRLVQHVPGVRSFVEFVSDDSRYVYYRSNEEARDSYTFYRYDIATGSKEKLFAQKGDWQIIDHQADGTLLLAYSPSSLYTEIWERPAQGGELKPILGHGEHNYYSARYGATPGELMVWTHKFGDVTRLYRYAGNQFFPISPALKWDVEGVHLDHARSKLYYSVNEGGYTRSYALDAKTYAPLKLPEFAGADHVQVAHASRDGNLVNLTVGTATAPATSYVYDWRSGTLTQWVLPSTPETDTSRFAVATLESYPARDGTPIPMFVRRPAQCATAATPCPVIVNFHGGPEGQTVAGFSATAQLYVDAGFVFVQPNVRGSVGYGKAWLNADNGPKRLKVITDIEDASRYIRKAWAKNGITPKVGVMGGSYGGYSTLVAMTMFAGAYDAGVSNVGISNLLTFLENTAPYRRALRISEYGDPVKDHDALVQLSPTTYIDRMRDPLLILAGASDPRVPVGEAIQMYQAAQHKGIPSELIIFADEGHGAQKRDNQVATVGHTLAFFERYLKGAAQ